MRKEREERERGKRERKEREERERGKRERKERGKRRERKEKTYVPIQRHPDTVVLMRLGFSLLGSIV